MSPRWNTSEMLPAELQRATPRPVRLTAGGWALAALAVASLAGAGIAGIWIHLAATKEAGSAEARVVEVTRTRGEKPWVVRYAYSVDGQEFSGYLRLRRRAPTLVEGAPIAIRYLVADPGRSWLAARGSRRVPLWLSPLVAVTLLGAATAASYALRREAVLLSEGRAALGRVLESKRVHRGGGHGAHTAYQTKVEFRLLSGALRVARFDGRKPLAVGQTVTVIYDRDEPARNRLYPLALVR